MPAATFKLAKRHRGRGHYAEVRVAVEAATVARIEVADDAFAWLKDDYGPATWEWSVWNEYRAGAVSGCQHAVSNLERAEACPPFHIMITRIHGHPAHTSAGDVAFAASQATWKALGVKGRNSPELV